MDVRFLGPGLLTAALLVAGGPSQALPEWARQDGVDCYQCHPVPPRMDEISRAFQANHFNGPGSESPPRSDPFPALPRAGPDGPGALTLGQWPSLRFPLKGVSLAEAPPGLRWGFSDHRGQPAAHGNYPSLGGPFKGLLAANREARLGGAYLSAFHGSPRRLSLPTEYLPGHPLAVPGRREVRGGQTNDIAPVSSGTYYAYNPWPDEVPLRVSSTGVSF